jgi:4-alpha-glucanotransferase
MIDLHQRSAGVLLHVTSLPGPHGIGDFGADARRFVDWLASAGQRLWQWLPTNPIGPGDSPYQSVSAFAGSPLMIALEPLVASGWLAEPSLPASGFDSLRVDFGRVIPWRLEQLRSAHAGFRHKHDASELRAFAAWQAAESSWLSDYALFMALEREHDGRPWWHWPEALRRREDAALTAARARLADEIDFWAFVQWCFDSQLAALKTYANGKGVAIMGDLPIFIAHHSADCWSRPDLYYLDAEFQPTVVAGCPPDSMAPTGQRWGNPLYRWDRMAAEDYAWWSSRLKRALAQADVFRIDHFRGFAGYYEIPASCPTAEQGEWISGPGRALFEAIERSLGKLPIVAEDLGLITEDVVELRDGLDFPGMKILQFGFDGDADNEFLPHNWCRHFVAYTGTHDNETVRGWWQKCTPRERAFAGSYLPASDQDIHWAMIRACCNSVANLAVFPLQDVLGLDAGHRMNTPGTLSSANWSWRFAWQWIGAEPTRVLALITAASGRCDVALMGLGRE